MLHLIETKELKESDKFAALHGKRRTILIAAEENGYEKFPEIPFPSDRDIREIQFRSGYVVEIGHKAQEDDVFCVWGYMPGSTERSETEIDADMDLMRGAFKDLEIKVVLLEDVLSFESRYAEDDRLEKNNGLNSNESANARRCSENKRINTQLILIAALAESAGVKWNERGAGTAISNITESFGYPVSDQTIRNILNKIPDAIERRDEQ